MKGDKINLANVCLCTPVRDEKMNPQGGIEKFIDSHAPFVNKMVVFDTESIDGTKEILEKAKKKYSNLIIPESTKFTGFGNLRNMMINYAKFIGFKNPEIEYALFLDADELITHQNPSNDWEIIAQSLKKNKDVYCFDFDEILPDGRRQPNSIYPERLFRIGGKSKSKKYQIPNFKNTLWEVMDYKGEPEQIPIKIKHFLPSQAGIEAKRKFHYVGGNPKEYYLNRIKDNTAPSQTKDFPLWKEYNPQRNNYE